VTTIAISVITEDAVLLAVLAVAGLRAAARLLTRRLSRRQRPEDDRVPAAPEPAGRRAYLGVTRPQSQLVRPYVLARAQAS
jgi:hypothetical protein